MILVADEFIALEGRDPVGDPGLDRGDDRRLPMTIERSPKSMA
jgi:hypothetical protein